jgi:hypothetical protein
MGVVVVGDSSTCSLHQITPVSATNKAGQTMVNLFCFNLYRSEVIMSNEPW